MHYVIKYMRMWMTMWSKHSPRRGRCLFWMCSYAYSANDLVTISGQVKKALRARGKQPDPNSGDAEADNHTEPASSMPAKGKGRGRGRGRKAQATAKVMDENQEDKGNQVTSKGWGACQAKGRGDRGQGTCVTSQVWGGCQAKGRGDKGQGTCVTSQVWGGAQAQGRGHSADTLQTIPEQEGTKAKEGTEAYWWCCCADSGKLGNPGLACDKWMLCIVTMGLCIRIYLKYMYIPPCRSHFCEKLVFQSLRSSMARTCANPTLCLLKMANWLWVCCALFHNSGFMCIHTIYNICTFMYSNQKLNADSFAPHEVVGKELLCLWLRQWQFAWRLWLKRQQERWMHHHFQKTWWCFPGLGIDQTGRTMACVKSFLWSSCCVNYTQQFMMNMASY